MNIKKFLIGGIAGFLMLGSLTLGAFASTTTIYNNIPDPLPGNLVSQAFEAQSASEFGGQVSFDGADRANPKVTVVMSSWGCENGTWTGNDCLTTPESTFSHPITLKIYNVNPDNSVGGLIVSKEQTFDIPYRPSASPSCGDGRWSSDGTNCYNGFATPITFDLTGTTLPDKVIVSLAYNTTHYGYAPIGEAASCFSESGGCGYDSLNVGLYSPPSVGTNPVPSDAYINSSWTGAYCSGDAGTFRLDSGCWTGYQPAVKFEVDHQEKTLIGKVTGGLTLKGPKQQISFEGFDYGNSNLDEGNVEYQNFEYSGGLHYTANLLCANVNKVSKDAWFMFQIPGGFPGLSGLYVVSHIKDGGTPGTKGDIYGHTATADLATAKSWCENGNAPVGAYVITGGNAVVHK